MAVPSNEFVKALYSYNGADQEKGLSFSLSTVLLVAQRTEDGWCRGACAGAVGWFPASYVKTLDEQRLAEVRMPSKPSRRRVWLARLMRLEIYQANCISSLNLCVRVLQLTCMCTCVSVWVLANIFMQKGIQPSALAAVIRSPQWLAYSTEEDKLYYVSTETQGEL